MIDVAIWVLSVLLFLTIVVWVMVATGVLRFERRVVLMDTRTGKPAKRGDVMSHLRDKEASIRSRLFLRW